MTVQSLPANVSREHGRNRLAIAMPSSTIYVEKNQPQDLDQPKSELMYRDVAEHVLLSTSFITAPSALNAWNPNTYLAVNGLTKPRVLGLCVWEFTVDNVQAGVMCDRSQTLVT